MADRISGHCGLAKLTRQINHRNRAWAYDLILSRGFGLEVSTMWNPFFKRDGGGGICDQQAQQAQQEQQ